MSLIRHTRFTSTYKKFAYYSHLVVYFFVRSLTRKKMRDNGRAIASSYDFFAVIAAWVAAYAVLVNMVSDVSITIPEDSAANLIKSAYRWQAVWINLAIILPIQVLLFRSFGLYRGFWRFASIQDLRKILYVSLLGMVGAWLLLNLSPAQMTFYAKMSFSMDTKVIFMPPLPLSALYGFFLAMLLASARLMVRYAKDYRLHNANGQRVIIVGAGNAGEGLARDLLRDHSHRFKPVVFVDDDTRKLGREIHGIRVAGKIAELPALIEKHDIDLVLIAIPSATAASMRSVLEMCERAEVRCYTLPSLRDLADGRVSIDVLRRVHLEDLLGRTPVTCQWSAIKSNLKNKTILVTGGGGSIGSELCRQITSLGEIDHLVIVDNNEFNLYSIEMELQQTKPHYQLHTVLMSVTDQPGIQAVMKQYQPNLVFHAAAYKHVPLLESQPRIAIYNNIVGTRILAQEARKAGVETFVLISSDKAVNPTNVMGATKRAAEYFCQNLNDIAEKTKFITVRFGNVLNSAGSVIPLFRKQIETGGPVTVTHPDIMRYFMTIPEAAQLILQAAFLGNCGEIFVLDMGDPIKIRYLAEQMIKLAGKVVDQDIKIIYTGLRPGEKLYEECFYSNETLQPTSHVKILKAQSSKRDFAEIERICTQLEHYCQADWISPQLFIERLKELVPEYQQEEMVNAPLEARA